jgi:tetratricopeptide (TPR) repeat protein
MNTPQSSIPNNREPSSIKKKKKVRKPGTGRPLGITIAIILLIGATILGILKLCVCYTVTNPRLNYIAVTKNSEALKLLEGETVHLHVRDKLRITDISTNVCFNRGVRIVSKGFDADSLTYGEVMLADLLPDKDIYSNHTFSLEVKQYNKVMGNVDLVVEPLVEDWLEKADKSPEGDERIEVLKHAQEVFPEERQIKDSLVKAYVSQKKWGNAGQILEGIVKEKPDQEALKNLLDVYENMSNTTGAVSVLRKMVDLSPDDMNFKLKLAEAFENAGRTTEAINTYEGLLDNVKGEDLLTAYNNLGYLYASTGENEKAISCYLKALELNDKDANLYHNLSLLYTKIGQKDKANQYLAKAAELGPVVDDRLTLAGNFLEGGKIVEAEKNVREFIKDNPRSMDAWLLMMKISEKKGDKASLKTAYESILDINPQNNTVIYNLGVMEYEAGNMDKAQLYLERYVQASPDDSDARSLLLEIYKQKKDDLTSKETSETNKLKPNETNSQQSDNINKKENDSNVAPIIEETTRATPKDVNSKKSLIAAYLKAGKESEAIAQIKEVLDVNPNDTETLLQLAKLYEKQNKVKEALSCYNRVLEISPDNEEAEEAYLRLKVKSISK